MKALEIVFITGMSGSGKSVALRALEDIGFYCVDNLPPELALAFIDLELQQISANQNAVMPRIAIAIDVRSAKSLPVFPSVLAGLEQRHVAFKLLFLDASDETLIHRYSESRRLHPLSTNAQNSDLRLAVQEAITLERELLADIRERAHIIETGFIRSMQLQSIVKDLVSVTKKRDILTVVFESFAFKRGVPLDADYVFDVRMLPNPHYEPHLKALTGRDQPVMDYLQSSAEVQTMQDQITQFISHWLAALQNDHRSYVTVAIGCTGGQHRSVYLVEQLATAFKQDWPVLVRHRELG
ncbi:MAG: RNase adapter RapZ [Cytophagales bacterium]|nr:RNase adapter RapZ [Cytophagales bacterium]